MSDQWYTATSGSGSFHLTITYQPARHETLTIDAFDLLKVIGKGSFGKVMQVRKKDTQRIYALKTIRKAHIASRPGEITHILAERTVLALVNNPFIVPLKFSFQNPDKLYLVLSFGEFGLVIRYHNSNNTFYKSMAANYFITFSGKGNLIRTEVAFMPQSYSVHWNTYMGSTLSIGAHEFLHWYLVRPIQLML